MLASAPTRPGLGTNLTRSDMQSLLRKALVMLYTIAVVLLILWLLGLVSSYTMGGFIHILLVVALVVILVNFISGRKSV
jgi:Family of unknown function (DUF5670)